jgi:hypothetical protein
MIKTKDKRRFFTHENHYPDLIQFSQAMGAEISVVKTEENFILDISELPTAICSQNYVSPNNYELLETTPIKYQPVKSSKRQNMLRLAKEVREFIKIELINNGTISHKKIQREFQKYDLSYARICNYLKLVCDELIDAGYVIKHIKRGEYQLLSKS